MKRGVSLFEVVLLLLCVSMIASLGFFLPPKSHLEQARAQVMGHLELTRFLALQDQKQILASFFCQSDSCKEEMERYEESYWRLQFHELKDIGWAYSIFSDGARKSKSKHFDDRPMDSKEVARSMFDSKFLSVYNYNNTKFANPLRDGDLAIQSRYGVIEVLQSGGCGEFVGGRVLFDHLGFLRCKSKKGDIVIPTNLVQIKLTDASGQSVGICISPSGMIQSCKE